MPTKLKLNTINPIGLGQQFTSRIQDTQDSILSTFRGRHNSTIVTGGAPASRDEKSRYSNQTQNQFVNYTRAQTSEFMKRRRQIGSKHQEKR